MSKSCRLYIHQWSLTAVVMYKQLCTTCIVLSPRCLHLARVPLWASTTKSRIVSSPICFLFSLLGLLVVAAQKTERESERGERREEREERSKYNSRRWWMKPPPLPSTDQKRGWRKKKKGKDHEDTESGFLRWRLADGCLLSIVLLLSVGVDRKNG